MLKNDSNGILTLKTLPHSEERVEPLMLKDDSNGIITSKKLFAQKNVLNH